MPARPDASIRYVNDVVPTTDSDELPSDTVSGEFVCVQEADVGLELSVAENCMELTRVSSWTDAPHSRAWFMRIWSNSERT